MPCLSGKHVSTIRIFMVSLPLCNLFSLITVNANLNVHIDVKVFCHNRVLISPYSIMVKKVKPK